MNNNSKLTNQSTVTKNYLQNLTNEYKISFNIAYDSYQENQFSQALEKFLKLDKMITIDHPHRVFLNNYIGDIYSHLKEFDLAIANYNKALIVDVESKFSQEINAKIAIVNNKIANINNDSQTSQINDFLQKIDSGNDPTEQKNIINKYLINQSTQSRGIN